MTPEAVTALLAEAKKPEPTTKKWSYWFSNAGEPCLRALVYDAQDADDDKPQARKDGPLKWLLSADCGNAVGARIESAARRLGYETQKAHVFETGAVRVSGHSDVADRQVVLDIKLVGEKSWARAPHSKHILQVNGYAVQNDSPEWALLYVRGSTIFDSESAEVETRLFTGKADIALAQELCGIWEDVEQHRKLRTLPERVFGAKPGGWPCGWCRHLERCAPPEEEQ